MSKKDKVQLELLRTQSEERKDARQVEQIKQSYIKEISKFKKEDLFPIPKKPPYKTRYPLGYHF